MKGRVYRHETKAFILLLCDVIVGIIRIVYTPTQRHKYLSPNLGYSVDLKNDPF